MITNEDAMKMAKYVGIDVSDGRETRVWASDLLAFANFIADLEREACAKMCDEIGAIEALDGEEGSAEMVRVADKQAALCAAAIRARGEK